MATLLKELYVGNVYGNWYLRLYEDSTSQSIDGNYSTVNLRLTLRADASTWVSFDARDAWIHGTHFSIAYRHDNPEHNLGSMSLTINHNADGTGSYSVGFGMATSYALNGSGAGGNVLPTIPRASTFSISGSTLGSAMTVNIARASTSFTHTVRYQFGSITRDYTGQTTSCSFTPPLTDASQIPNNASGQGTMTVLTYSGSTHIGTKSLPFTQNLPSSAVPSFSALNITRVDNGVPAAWGIYVKNKSKANVVISGATGIYGSTIKSYSISGGGYSANASSLSTGTLASGSITFTGTISDSRGRSATKTISITVYENTLPALSLKAERCDKNGSISNVGTYLKITPTYSCASVNGKNSIASKTFTIAGTTYKNTTASSGTSFILGDGAIAISKSYDVTGVVVDALAQTSGTLTIKVPSSSVPMNLRDDKTGIAFGKYSEKQNAIDSAWDIYVKNNRVMPMSTSSGYWGFPDIADFIRTPPNGLIPYSATSGGSLGTSSWRFTTLWLRGDVNCSSIYTSSWFRSTGVTGWYNQTYGGGIYMEDTTWVKVYAGKRFLVENFCQAHKFIITSIAGRSPGIAISGGGDDINHVSELIFIATSSPFLQVYTPNQSTKAWGVAIWASDAKLKKNIKSVSYKKSKLRTAVNTSIHALELIQSFQHFSFDFIENDNHVNLGYVADELEKIFPDGVYEVDQGKDENGDSLGTIKHVNPTTLIPLITLAMQEQSNKIDVLEQRVEALEKLLKK